MQRKLNEEFLKEYSEQFSEKVTSAYFSEHESISGKEILTITSSRQVNFFILKSLFGKWQDEMKKLESPYFNYKSTEVRRAMVDFMNILSQHIEIEGDHFIELVEEAVRDTVILLLAPDQFLEAEFKEKGISEVNDKISKPFLKYVKLYKEPLTELFSRCRDQSIDELLDEATNYFEEFEDDDIIVEEINHLSEILSVGRTEFLMDEEASEEKEEDEDLQDHEEEVDQEESATYDEDEDEDDPEEVDETPVEEELENAADQPEEDESDQTEELSDEVDSHSEEEKADESEDPDDTINEKYTEPQSTVNDQFSEEGNTVVDQLQQQKVSSIMEAISVNHRYMFTKELFDGDKEAFTLAVEEIEERESFDDAVELMVEKFAKERDWDMNSDEVKELLKIVFRKFR